MLILLPIKFSRKRQEGNGKKQSSALALNGTARNSNRNSTFLLLIARLSLRSCLRSLAILDYWRFTILALRCSFCYHKNYTSADCSQGRVLFALFTPLLPKFSPPRVKCRRSRLQRKLHVSVVARSTLRSFHSLRGFARRQKKPDFRQAQIVGENNLNWEK